VRGKGEGDKGREEYGGREAQEKKRREGERRTETANALVAIPIRVARHSVIALT
jgi:hypothetical protein